jgi:hypothetical protein
MIGAVGALLFGIAGKIFHKNVIQERDLPQEHSPQEHSQSVTEKNTGRLVV